MGEPQAANDESLDRHWSEEVEKVGLTHKRFTELYALAIKSLKPDAEVKVLDEDRIEIRFAEGVAGISYTENPWRLCKDLPGERRATLRICLADAVRSEIMDNQVVQETDIVPLIKGDDFLKATKHSGVKVYHEEVSKGLHLVYALDEEDALTFIDQNRLDALKLSKTDLKELALANLHKRVADNTFLNTANDRYGMPTIDGVFESSLVLFETFMTAMSEQFQNDLMFVIPNRDIVLLGPRSDQELQAWFKSHAKKSFKEYPHPISTRLYTWKEGKIIAIS